MGAKVAQVADYVEGLSLLAKQINDQVHLLIDHPGEKGRAGEHIVRSLVRNVLPKKFSIGTGFIVTSTGIKELSDRHLCSSMSR